jgi:hypothetical protein
MSNDAQASLIVGTLEGFYEAAKRVGSKFLKQRKDKLRGLPAGRRFYNKNYT